MNNIVTYVDSLLFLDADITYRTGGYVGVLALSAPKAWVRRPKWELRADI